MDINEMTRKQFEELPYLDGVEKVDVDSIVLLPSKKHHSSGFNCYEVVACNKWRAIGKCYRYDTFSIYMDGKYNRVGIDCLRGSGLIRIFLPPNEYYVEPMSHEIRRKKDVNEFLEKMKDIEEVIKGNGLKSMWDKWKETLIDEYKGEENGKETEN